MTTTAVNRVGHDAILVKHRECPIPGDAGRKSWAIGPEKQWRARHLGRSAV